MPLGKMLGVPGWAARFPGRENRIRETPLPTITAMADQLAAAIRDLDTDELVLFGHCSGALVAYEVALRLPDRNGLKLMASACAAPGWRFDDSRPVAAMSDEELAAQLAADGGTDETLLRNKSFVVMMLPVYRADVLAVERYQLGPERERLRIPVTVVAGKDDEDIPHAAFAAWARLVDGPFDIQLLDGGHFYLGQNERAVAGLLRHFLARSWAGARDDCHDEGPQACRGAD